MRFAAILLLSAAACTPVVAASDDFSTSAGPVRITPLQHASILVEAGGKVIYIDPAQGNYDARPAADLILFTHEHGDHISDAALAKLRRPATAIFAPEAVASRLPGATVIRNGDSKTWGAFRIDAVPAYNIKRERAAGQPYHPKGRGNGYVLAYGSKRFYIAGDTENIPEMRALNGIEAAFIPMNLPYTMTPEEAAEAVRAFHPRVVYPYHSRGTDLKAFEKALAGSGIEVRIRDWYGV